MRLYNAGRRWSNEPTWHNRTQHSRLTLNGNVWKCIWFAGVLAIPGRDGPVIFEQRHRSRLLIRVKTPVKQSKLIKKPATTNNEWMTWISQPGPSPVTGQLLPSSPRAKKLYSLITTFREIHKYPWALCLPAVSLEKLPKSVRLTGNPWDLTGLAQWLVRTTDDRIPIEWSLLRIPPTTQCECRRFETCIGALGKFVYPTLPVFRMRHNTLLVPTVWCPWQGN